MCTVQSFTLRCLFSLCMFCNNYFLPSAHVSAAKPSFSSGGRSCAVKARFHLRIQTLRRTISRPVYFFRPLMYYVFVWCIKSVLTTFLFYFSSSYIATLQLYFTQRRHTLNFHDLFTPSVWNHPKNQHQLFQKETKRSYSIQYESGMCYPTLRDTTKYFKSKGTWRKKGFHHKPKLVFPLKTAQNHLNMILQNKCI